VRGVTTTTPFATAERRPGDVLAILALADLGHLGVSICSQSRISHRGCGCERGQIPLAKELGAHFYIDSTVSDSAAELQKLGERA